MNKAKILIIEDETIIALDIKNTIKKFGHTITNTVTNYDDAISSVQQNEPNVILIDINLGKNSKDGIETAIDIKKIKNIPIIYITASLDDEIIARSIKTNPVGYIKKPYREEQLKVTIMLALHSH